VLLIGSGMNLFSEAGAQSLSLSFSPIQTEMVCGSPPIARLLIPGKPQRELRKEQKILPTLG
jgi:hypothetical protein